MSTNTIQKLQSWLETSKLSQEQFISIKEIPSSEINERGEYMKLSGLIQVNNDSNPPSQFFFYPSGQPALWHVYGRDHLKTLSVKDILDFYGEEETQERSRAGKTANYFIYAHHGFAFSEAKGDIHFVDLFPPMTTADFLSNLYLDPGPFIR